jgi:pilus assembly protein CpaF
MTPAAVHAQLVSAVDVVVHLGRRSVDGVVRRRVETIGVLVRGADGRPEVRDALKSDLGEDGRGPGWPDLLEVLGVSLTKGREALSAVRQTGREARS